MLLLGPEFQLFKNFVLGTAQYLMQLSNMQLQMFKSITEFTELNEKVDRIRLDDVKKDTVVVVVKRGEEKRRSAGVSLKTMSVIMNTI